MALTLSNAAASAMLGDTVNKGLEPLFDAGTPPGQLHIWDAGKAHLLVTCDFSAIMGTVTTNVLTANTISDGTAVATYTAAVCELHNAAGTGIITGLTVGTSGTNIILNSTTITTGDVIRITALTITLPVS
jgi:hypothetical protein